MSKKVKALLAAVEYRLLAIIAYAATILTMVFFVASCILGQVYIWQILICIVVAVIAVIIYDKI